MTEVFGEYWLPIVAAIVVTLILVLLLLRPKQRVSLTESAPVRPHMPASGSTDRKPIVASEREGRGIADELAAATSDVSGQILTAPVHSHLPGASGPPDDLQKLKGVGPKLADMLNARGITRYEHLARLTPHAVERLEESFGAFRGRFERDKIVEQADYLARGDIDGFEHRFGKL